ncbi:MAG: glycoside hydrolase family 95 protein [Clostridia bacterium]|nr:glycoside hydrolase family 95 protein [Clostridia bacterium]
MKKHDIFLRSPASEWELAFPTGCGKLGGMLYGDTSCERLQLNEERIWAGSETSFVPEGFMERFLHVRRLLLEGKPVEAEVWAKEHMNDVFTRVSSYETAGELTVTLPEGEVTGYERRLSLEDGIASVRYEKQGVHYLHENFASYPAQTVALRISADGKFDALIGYERQNLTALLFSRDGIALEGVTAKGNHYFRADVKLITDGEISLSEGISVKGARSVTLLIAIKTGGNPVISRTDYEELKAEHIADMNAMMGRSSLEFAGDPALDALPTDERIARIRDGGDDPGLVSTYFAFGKYLLISSSRGDSLPANLQGVWNGYMNAPWSSDYHTNVNLQMNYWHAEAANLSDCTLPLFAYMRENLHESGKRTARDFYGLEGMVVHHLSDIYGYTQIADGLWGMWQYGGAWLCRHIKEHWLYTGDKDFLAEQYDFLADNVRFMLGLMFEHEGVMLTGPSVSPENSYFTDGVGSVTAQFCLSPSMDVEIIGELLDFYVEAEAVLGRDPALARRAKDVRTKLPKLKVGKHGQLMEWLHDYDEPEPGHRHVSHLYALSPDCAINSTTPELMKACEVTLRRRLASGGGHTGWSCAWLINLFARLGLGEDAYAIIRKLFAASTKDNLLDTHPPFQIDGNFGAAAGIIEMLLQSHAGVIRLLPALPKALGEGCFEGLMARGGVVVSAAWKESSITKFTLTASRDVSFNLVYGEKEEAVTLKAGECFSIQ